MSFIQPSVISVIAHSIDLPGLTDEAAKALAPDVEYRLREVIQESQKFARHSKRTKLITEDVNNALRARNIEPVYGFSGNKDPAKYVKATGHPDVSIVHDRELQIDQSLQDITLPPPPVQVGVLAHWLFIGGVQPSVPENIPIEKPVAKRQKIDFHDSHPSFTQQHANQQQGPGTKAEGSSGRAAANHQSANAMQPTQSPSTSLHHTLPVELITYFNKVIEVLKEAAAEIERGDEANILFKSTQQPGGSGSTSQTKPLPQQLLKAVLASLSTDPGLHTLSPYFTKFVTDEVAAHLQRPAHLRVMLTVAAALIRNPHMALEAYIHQLMPPLLTCLVADSIGPPGDSEHWGVRDLAARVISAVCTRFAEPHYSIAPRLSRTFTKLLNDTSKALPSIYGAIRGLGALGDSEVSVLLVPHVEPLVRRLVKFMAGRDTRSKADGAGGHSMEGSELARIQAWRVYGALLDTVGSTMYRKMLEAAAERIPKGMLRVLRPRLRRVSLEDDNRAGQKDGLDDALERGEELLETRPAPAPLEYVHVQLTVVDVPDTYMTEDAIINDSLNLPDHDQQSSAQQQQQEQQQQQQQQQELHHHQQQDDQIQHHEQMQPPQQPPVSFLAPTDHTSTPYRTSDGGISTPSGKEGMYDMPSFCSPTYINIAPTFKEHPSPPPPQHAQAWGNGVSHLSIDPELPLSPLIKPLALVHSSEHTSDRLLEGESKPAAEVPKRQEKQTTRQWVQLELSIVIMEEALEPSPEPEKESEHLHTSTVDMDEGPDMALGSDVGADVLELTNTGMVSEGAMQMDVDISVNESASAEVEAERQRRLTEVFSPSDSMRDEPIRASSRHFPSIPISHFGLDHSSLSKTHERAMLKGSLNGVGSGFNVRSASHRNSTLKGSEKTSKGDQGAGHVSMANGIGVHITGLVIRPAGSASFRHKVLSSKHPLRPLPEDTVMEDANGTAHDSHHLVNSSIDGVHATTCPESFSRHRVSESAGEAATSLPSTSLPVAEQLARLSPSTLPSCANCECRQILVDLIDSSRHNASVPHSTTQQPAQTGHTNHSFPSAPMPLSLRTEGLNALTLPSTTQTAGPMKTLLPALTLASVSSAGPVDASTPPSSAQVPGSTKAKVPVRIQGGANTAQRPSASNKSVVKASIDAMDIKARQVLANSWMEGADLDEVLGALSGVLGEAFICRMPHSFLASALI